MARGSSTSNSSGEGAAPKLLTASRIRELARRHDIRPSKSLGQNFVIDPNTIRRIVRLADVNADDDVVEVGAGLGTLTLGLAAAAKSVTAIEFDRALLPALDEVLRGISNVVVISADAMKVDYRELLGLGERKLISNLPYNLAVPLLLTLFGNVPQITEFVVMVQREVGERLAAKSGSKAYGSVSVQVTYFTEARILGRVPQSVFWPVPKVESVIVKMVRREPAVDVDANRFIPFVRGAFAQRRKTLANALASHLQTPGEGIRARLAEIGLSEKVRAEELTLEELARVFEAVSP